MLVVPPKLVVPVDPNPDDDEHVFVRPLSPVTVKKNVIDELATTDLDPLAGTVPTSGEMVAVCTLPVEFHERKSVVLEVVELATVEKILQLT